MTETPSLAEETERMQVVDVARVVCPICGEDESIPVPAGDVELKIRSTVAAFGEHRKIRCSHGHTYWVYYC